MMVRQGEPLPKNILKKCTPTIKNKLSQFVDIQDVKVTKVKGHKDPKCKTAYLKIYVMKDRYVKLLNDNNYAVKLALIDHWTKTPTWHYYNPRTDRFEQGTAPLAKDVSEYYVLLQSNETYNANAYFKKQDLKHARENTKNIFDPHKAQPWDYEGVDGQIKNQKLYVSAMVGVKTRELKIQLIQEELDRIAEKFKFNDNENVGYRISSNTKSGNFGCYTYTDEKGYLDACVFVNNENDITVEVDLNRFMIMNASTGYRDAKEIRNNLRKIADICDRAVKFEKALQNSKELKDLLIQIK